MSENYIVINGKRAELTEEQLENLGINTGVIKNPFARRVNKGYGTEEKYCYIASNGTVHSYSDKGGTGSTKRYEVANYCNDENMMKQRALHETLNRLLWRYSMEHDGDNIDWPSTCYDKYYIFYNYRLKCFDIDTDAAYRSLNTVYFSKECYAEKAITEIIEPFIKNNPDFVW